jgi:uncharacterized membrane protein YuzA (DUF378 family)
VFGSIGSNGYIKDENQKDECIINGNGSACSYAIWVGLIGFFASMGFIAGEYLFEQMSSAKSRKHYVLADLGFSGFWAFMYFVGFCYISSQWSKSADPPNGVGSGNVTCAITFCFLSIFSWAGCTYFAFLRFKAGVTEIPFQSTYESDPVNQAAYSSYPDANENEQYQEPPFSQQQAGQGQFQQFQTPNY